MAQNSTDARARQSESTATPLNKLIAALERGGHDPRQNGKGWKSLCPGHDDNKPSFEFKEGNDGTVVVKCRAGCETPDVIAKLGLKMADLFPGSNRIANDGKKFVAGQGWPTIDGAVGFLAKKLGATLGQRWQYSPDFYVQRFNKPDGSKEFSPVWRTDGRWKLKKPPGQAMLYRQGELAAAATVWIVEGEKCADLVHGQGLIATTSPGGAEAAARADWSVLAGKTIAIIPDNNKPGEKYAEAVAMILSKLDPKPTIKIVRLPLNDPKDDFEQWLDLVSETWGPEEVADDLRRRLDDAAEWTPPEPSARKDPLSEPSAASDQGGVNHLTELGNARRLIAVHGQDVRYCKSLGAWLDWDGHRWCPDERGAIWRRAKDIVRQLAREAISAFDDNERTRLLRWALKSEEKKVMGASIELAWSEPDIAILPDELDRDPWLLNTPAGTVDLKTGKLREHRQSDLISKITGVPYDASAKCPRWVKTLGEIFSGDLDLVGYVQRALGYSLTGVIGEHALFLCYGTGRNGKNTVLDTVLTILGDYATIANPRTFMTIGQGDHLAMVADLMGRRFVPTDEVEEGEQLAESMVKRVTGNKLIKARFMHKNPFTFPALFKIWMVANCKPEIHGQDEGIWSRIRLIPFEVFFPPEKRIKNLADILIAEEGPGILRWLVEGCLEWQRTGLNEPTKVLDATKDYRSEQDMVGGFIGQCCDSFLDRDHLLEKKKENTGKLYGRYVDWCKANGEKKVMTKRRFGSDLTKRGYVDKPSDGVHYRQGITLKDTGENTSDETGRKDLDL
jgi:putative DNA primase/helicase